MNQTDALDRVAVGAIIGATPWWAEMFHTVSSAAGFICVVTGAIIGLHGVYRICRPRRAS